MGNSPIVSRINGLLAEKGISKRDFYQDCGITSASYSLWNTGKTTPRMKNLEVIADYLETTTDYLLTGLGEKEKAPTQEGEREIGFDDFTYAFYEESKDLPDEKKKMLLEMARFMKADIEKEKG
nr:MAG TPA: Repressor protein CI [Caudoviricetes sp.]DAP52167.1 MAG TPA: Repressor protein CI [Caudoviricetes sp.]